MNALVVEDHPEIRREIVGALRTRGHDVIGCADAEEAWRVWTEASFQLVLLDLGLLGEEGLSLCRRMRAHPSGDHCVIIVVTNAVDPAHLDAVLSAGADDYVAKPLTAALLAVRLAIAERRVAERTDAKEASRERDARFRTAFDLAATGMALVAPNGRWLQVNRALCEIVGYQPDELIGGRFQDITHPEDLESDLSYERHMLAGTLTTYQMEKRCVHKLGQVIWVLLSVSLVRDATGEPLYFVTQIQDITERKRVESNLAEERELLRVVMDHVPDFLYVKDAQSRFLHVDRKGAGFLGLADPAEVVGKTDFDFFPESLAQQYFADEQQVVATGEPILNRLEAQDEAGTTWALTSTVPVKDEAGRVERLVGVARDVSDRMRIEEALRQSEARQRALLDAIPDAMFRFDRSETFLDYKADHLGNLLVPLDEIVGTRIGDALPAHFADLSRRAIARVLAGEPMNVFECDLDERGQAKRFEARTVACGADEALMLVRDVTERKALEERLANQATHDPLTGLPNRALFAERLDYALARARRRARPVAVLFVDIDDFKIVNDTLGHESGDRMLVSGAKRLQGCIRDEDTAARLGGDEFAVLLEEFHDVDEVEIAAKRITAALGDPLSLLGREVATAASVGVAISPAGRERPEELLRQADAAMYAAKQAGKGRHAVFAPGMDSAAWVRLGLEAELRGAGERSEFELHYQPIVWLATGGVAAVEALVRWRHPTRGLLGPDEFVPLAEETGLIVPLGRWVLTEACRQASIWQNRLALDQGLVVSVNLSARQFRDPNLVDDVARALAETELPAACLQLELTEGALVDDVERASVTMEQLRATGVRLALDDFGAGYAGLAYLRRLPVDAIKLDRALVADLSEPQDIAILRTVVELSRVLQKVVTAEGVETEEHLKVVRELGCHQAQGFAVAPPLPGVEAEAFLTARARWSVPRQTGRLLALVS